MLGPAASRASKAARSGTAAAGKTLETGMARLALGVDFAAVELGALLLVAENLISGVGFGKPVLGLGIIRMLVGMMQFGELAKRFFHIRVGSVLGDAENLIRIAHFYPLSP